MAAMAAAAAVIRKAARASAAQRSGHFLASPAASIHQAASAAAVCESTSGTVPEGIWAISMIAHPAAILLSHANRAQVRPWGNRSDRTAASTAAAG